MNDTITADELVTTLMDYCKGYTAEVREKVGECIETVGEEALEEVKSLAPVYAGSDKSVAKGAYRRNWTYLIEKSNGNITVTVHVKGRHYRLTHLLENGHLTRNGITRTRPIPHISIANDHAQQKVLKLLEEI